MKYYMYYEREIARPVVLTEDVGVNTGPVQSKLLLSSLSAGKPRAGPMEPVRSYVRAAKQELRDLRNVTRAELDVILRRKSAMRPSRRLPLLETKHGKNEGCSASPDEASRIRGQKSNSSTKSFLDYCNPNVERPLQFFGSPARDKSKAAANTSAVL